jgi:hypothetical protein
LPRANGLSLMTKHSIKNKILSSRWGFFYIWPLPKKMRTTLGLLLLIVGNAFAQPPASLQAEVRRLYTACHDIDIAALTEMLCTTDTDAYAKLDSHFQNDETKFRYVETSAKYNYAAPKTVDGKTYYLINFRNVIRVTYFKPIDVAAKQAELKAKFAAQEINYNQQRNAFMIVYNAKLVAIQDNGWKFAFTDPTLPNVSDDCLTEPIKTALGL